MAARGADTCRSRSWPAAMLFSSNQLIGPAWPEPEVLVDIADSRAVRSCDSAAKDYYLGLAIKYEVLDPFDSFGHDAPLARLGGPAGPDQGGHMGGHADAAGRGARAAKGRSISGIRKDLPRGPAGIVVEPCPSCDQADLEPQGEKHVCPRCGYTQP